MIARAQTETRRAGVFVPLRDVEAHLALGWSILSDLVDDVAGQDFALLAPPPVEAEAA